MAISTSGRSSLSGVLLALFCLFGAYSVGYCLLQRPPAAMSYEGYEQQGYEDAKDGVPAELCEYEGMARSWYLRGYKKGWKELHEKS